MLLLYIPINDQTANFVTELCTQRPQNYYVAGVLNIV